MIKLNFKLLKDATVLQAALAYAAAGIKVVPLEKNSKKLPGGDDKVTYSEATTDPKIIKEWFGVRFPQGNIGIATGGEGGVFALDVDAMSSKGISGLDEFHKLTKKNEMPKCPVQRTPKGGLHFLMQWQQDAISSSSKIANGIDTRGGRVCWP